MRLNLNGLSTLQEKHILHNSKLSKFSQQNLMNTHLFGEKKRSLYSIADFSFVLERLVSEKIHFRGENATFSSRHFRATSSRRIGVRFSRAFQRSQSQSDCRIFRILPDLRFRLLTNKIGFKIFSNAFLIFLYWFFAEIVNYRESRGQLYYC